MLYKKGKGQLIIPLALIGLLFVSVGMVGTVWYFGVQQTSLAKSAAAPATTPSGAIQSNVGDSATVKFRAYDQMSNSLAQVAATLYVRDVASGQLLNDATAMSASDSTNTASTIGATLESVAFSSSYYGGLSNIPVVKEVQPEAIKVWAIATGDLDIDFFDDGTVMTTSGNAVGNITIGADQVGTLDKIRIEQNNSNAAYNLKAIVVNVTDTTDNLKAVSVGKFDKLTVPDMMKEAEYAVQLPVAVLLNEFEVFESGVVVLEASGTNPAQTLVFSFLDESYFKSVKVGTERQLLKGIQDDQSTPANVGGAHFVRTLGIT